MGAPVGRPELLALLAGDVPEPVAPLAAAAPGFIAKRKFAACKGLVCMTGAAEDALALGVLVRSGVLLAVFALRTEASSARVPNRRLNLLRYLRAA